MRVDEDIAMKLWKDVFGDEKWAVDCYGTWMYRDDYGKIDVLRVRPGGNGKKYNYCWNVDHIKPVSEFATEERATFWNNLEPVQLSNNSAKSNNLNFSINGVRYQVVKCDICRKHNQEGYGIKNVETGKRVDWKYVKNCYYA